MTHSKFGISRSIGLITTCTTGLKLQRGLPDISNGAADIGTEIHELMEAALKPSTKVHEHVEAATLFETTIKMLQRESYAPIWNKMLVNKRSSDLTGGSFTPKPDQHVRTPMVMDGARIDTDININPHITWRLGLEKTNFRMNTTGESFTTKPTRPTEIDDD